MFSAFPSSDKPTFNLRIENRLRLLSPKDLRDKTTVINT